MHMTAQLWKQCQHKNVHTRTFASYFLIVEDHFLRELVLTTPFHEIVEDHFLHQDNKLRPLFSRTNRRTSQIKEVFKYHCRGLSGTLSGSQIPNWFDHQCKASSVTVLLQPNRFFSKFLGIAICAVSNFQGAVNNASLQSASCVCTLKGNHAVQSFSFPLLHS